MGNYIKALTLWQPWASLVMAGIKRFETRGWRTSYRGPLGIQASKKNPRDYFYKLDPLMVDAAKMALGVIDFNDLPRGCMLGTVELDDCLEITETGLFNKYSGLLSFGEISMEELRFGNYQTGRYAFELDEPLPFDAPIPAAGQQGLWMWEMPQMHG